MFGAVGLYSPKPKANTSIRTTAEVFIFLLSLDWSSCLSRIIWIWIMGWKCLPQWIYSIDRVIWYQGHSSLCPHTTITHPMFGSELTNRRWVQCCSIRMDWELFVLNTLVPRLLESISHILWYSMKSVLSNFRPISCLAIGLRHGIESTCVEHTHEHIQPKPHVEKSLYFIDPGREIKNNVHIYKSVCE